MHVKALNNSFGAITRTREGTDNTQRDKLNCLSIYSSTNFLFSAD